MKKVIIIGAGNAGQHILDELLRKSNYEVIGFLDADEKKQGERINGYKVLGDHANIKKFINEYEVDEVIVGTTTINHEDLEFIYDKLKEADINIRVLPTFEELLIDKPFTNQLREVKVEDLLGRDPITINSKSIQEYILGEVVFITGAAGSIGSELCKQIVKYQPKKIVMLDINENDLYLLELYLKRHYGGIDTELEICNIREREKLDYLFNLYKPDIVFHAAAHKHVPLLEKNIEEAIKNNVIGTQNLMVCADKYKVEKFVLISTDKAVNPTNVMGATKRLAELLLEDINHESKTKFMAVRFGNVLGSNGSVVEIFKSLLEEGRDLTVTHEEVTRYFMTIPEAAQLVIEAGFIGTGGEIFVLDMGEPVKIMDLAKRMIELSGLELGEDVDIKITGLRPGEKLYEELLYDIDSCKKTQNDKIYIAEIKKEDINLKEKLVELEKVLKNFNREKMKIKLKELVPTYEEVDYEE